MTAPQHFPDAVGGAPDKSGEYCVRFNGMICTPRWAERGPAEAYLALLQGGWCKPQYSDDIPMPRGGK